MYKTIQVTINSSSILCCQEGWKEEDSMRLLISQWLVSGEQLSVTLNFRSHWKH